MVAPNGATIGWQVTNPAGSWNNYYPGYEPINVSHEEVPSCRWTRVLTRLEELDLHRQDPDAYNNYCDWLATRRRV